MRILIFCATYPPATGGGTVRAIEGLVSLLGGTFEFLVFTRAGQDGAEGSPSASPGQWVDEGHATVFRANRRDLAPDRVVAAVKEAQSDVSYVNSLFSPTFGIQPVMLRWSRAVPRTPIIIAPRGELHPGALRFKRAKKVAFLELARRSALYRDVFWQAASAEEAAQIERWFPSAKIAIARDLAALVMPSGLMRLTKTAGELKIVSLSRITPVKNLTGAMRIISRLKGEVTFDLFGPPVEARYLRECCELARRLPPNVRFRWGGEVPHERVLETISAYHVFLLPTYGESFGHAILEAFVAGVPPVISDQTPWHGLEMAGAGWDLPLIDEDGFVRALQSCVAMDQERWLAMSARARKYGMAAVRSPEAFEENRRLFVNAVGGAAGLS